MVKTLCVPNLHPCCRTCIAVSTARPVAQLRQGPYLLYPFSYYMYTCIRRCVVDLHYVCICMLYVYMCDHVHSNVSTALMVSKHICALVRELMIQDVCAWIFGGGSLGEVISDPFFLCVCSDLLPPLCK
jgi:hypothetical protein